MISSLILDLPISSNKINLILFSLNFLSFLTKLIKIFLLLISSFGNSNLDINRVDISYSSFDKLPNLFERYKYEFSNHPMTETLEEGLLKMVKPKRRGGWKSRHRSESD